MTALWALVVIVNERILASVDPPAVDFFVRIAAIVGLILITVPLTVLRLWDNGFGINAAAAGWMALSAVATWLIAFTAYYCVLRGERVAVVVSICSTDPLWTALFAWLILGAAFGGLTFAGMAVAMAGVLLITGRLGARAGLRRPRLRRRRQADGDDDAREPGAGYAHARRRAAPRGHQRRLVASRLPPADTEPTRRLGRSSGRCPCTPAACGASIDRAGVERAAHRSLGSREPPSPVYPPGART
jgi:uncharacterized membrane protein